MRTTSNFLTGGLASGGGLKLHEVITLDWDDNATWSYEYNSTGRLVVGVERHAT